MTNFIGFVIQIVNILPFYYIYNNSTKLNFNFIFSFDSKLKEKINAWMFGIIKSVHIKPYVAYKN